MFCLLFVSFIARNDDVTTPLKSMSMHEKHLATFSTVLNQDQKTRNHNIMLACESIDGFVVEQGGEFSFNDVVGARVKEEGYLEARGIEYGKSVPSIGGGICQVSTTLYNLALLSGFAISERMHHSRPVMYVPEGFDAMVAWQASDLRFVNTLNVPVVIKAWSDENRITMTCAVADGYENMLDLTWESIEIVNKRIETVEPKSKGSILYGERGDHPPATNVSEMASLGLEGIRVQVVRRFIEKDGSFVNEIVSEDFYEPTYAVLK